jgi:hypothetical protein
MELIKAFALAVPARRRSGSATVAFFQAVKAAVVKSTSSGLKDNAEMDHAIRQIVSKAIAADEAWSTSSPAARHGWFQCIGDYRCAAKEPSAENTAVGIAHRSSQR